jgi:AraC-like DNA-binding protein
METLVDAQRPEAPLMPNPGGLCLAHSIDEAIDLVGSSLSPHTLKVAGGGGQVLANLSALNLGDCAMASLRYGFDVDIDAGYIADWFMLKMTLSGEGRITSDQHVAATSYRSIFVTSPHARTRFRMSASCRHLTTRLARRVVEEHLSQKLGRRLDMPLEFALEIPSDSDFGRAWWQLVRHICEISATAPTVLACEEVRKQYSRTMIELLLHAAPHNYSDALNRVDGQLLPRCVRRAQDYIAEHLAEIRSVAEIAAAIGVSPRTLQNGFKQALDVSPAEYVRQARIRELHRALLAAEPSQSVTTLMTAVGISSFGRYAEYYRQQIGVPPSETLRRA